MKHSLHLEFTLYQNWTFVHRNQIVIESIDHFIPECVIQVTYLLSLYLVLTHTMNIWCFMTKTYYQSRLLLGIRLMSFIVLHSSRRRFNWGMKIIRVCWTKKRDRDVLDSFQSVCRAWPWIQLLCALWMNERRTLSACWSKRSQLW